MPEAEDVLLEVAERATWVVRATWERHRGSPRRGEEPSATAAHRRLAAWQTAWLGRSWPIACFGARPAPGPIARWLRRLPPWASLDETAPYTDGRRICLPRAWLEEAGDAAAPERALLATLGLARRLARGSASGTAPAPRLARDLWWLAEGALGDAALVRAWPGLGPALRALRQHALALRPDVARLAGAERAVEDWLRSLLAAPAERPAPELLYGLAPDADPEEIAAFALQRAASLAAGSAAYRGLAPVTYWGVHRPVLAAGAGEVARGAAAEVARPRRGARLSRPLERRTPDESDGARPGPFVLPYSDAHLAVEDPGALARPADQGRDEDPDALAEELARLEGLPVVRDDARVSETLEDGGSSLGEASRGATLDGTDPVWLYPEWDAARGCYRDPGCRVREVPAPDDDGGWSAAALDARRVLLARLRQQLAGLRPRRQRLRRQPDGDDLDLCGWVDDWADRRAERPALGRIYTQEQRRRRDVAVALLLDASGSTESWLSGRQRVIDVVKEAALAFGEALATLGDRHALQAFSGRSAGDVRIRVLKRYDERPGPAVHRRIGALEPDAFTRLGGAVRHATAGLARERARARLLLVLTDGKPQDEDGYEGVYGIEDGRQAMAEARLQGVRVFGITIDRQGADYLPRLFGPHGYTVLWNAEALPERLPWIYRRLTAGA